MDLKEQINSDLKNAMLSGEKDKVMTLRSLKSAILYAEVAEGKRDSGLSNDDTIAILQKEAKKRTESAVLYRQGNNIEKAEKEEAEKQIIDSYLPAQMSEQELRGVISKEIQNIDDVSMKHMGQIINAVKQKYGNVVDGSVVAKLVKEQLK